MPFAISKATIILHRIPIEVNTNPGTESMSQVALQGLYSALHTVCSHNTAYENLHAPREGFFHCEVFISSQHVYVRLYYSSTTDVRNCI